MQLHKAPLSIRISIWFFLVASIAGFASANAWAQSTYRCGPVPAVKAALDQLPQRTPAQTEWQYHQQRVAALQPPNPGRAVRLQGEERAAHL